MLLDDSSTHNFLNYMLVKKLRLAQVPSSHKYVVSLMNGIDTDVWDTEVKDVNNEDTRELHKTSTIHREMESYLLLHSLKREYIKMTKC